MKVESIVSVLRSLRGNDAPLFLILGPCSLESLDHARLIASFLKELSLKLGFTLIFKSSFDKANRTSSDGYRSLGLEEGCSILAHIRKEFDVPVTTDIHESSQAEEVGSVVDILQIPAFLCRQTDLLIAAGKTGKIVNIKKGQFAAPHIMEHAARKVTTTGNGHVWLCERGFVFGYGDLIVDFRAFPIMKKMGYPVVFDVTHAVQKPSGLGTSSGGERACVADLAIAAVSQGIAGLFMEVHEEPERARCDGPNSVRLSHLEDLLCYILELDRWVKGRTRPLIY